MKDSEIIKALDCRVRIESDPMYEPSCEREPCNYAHGLMWCKTHELHKDAIDLITRQKAEIKKLKEAIITADECFSEGLFAKGFDTIINILSEVRNETN